jgi:DNA transposition AAA+ family ATPase
MSEKETEVDRHIERRSKSEKEMAKPGVEDTFQSLCDKRRELRADRIADEARKMDARALQSDGARVQGNGTFDTKRRRL